MSKKKLSINLAPTIKPQTGDLEKLFTTEQDIEQASGLQLLAIRLDAIQPDPHQPRQTFDGATLEELAASIRQDGVIQPIEVTEITPGRYLIVHGERRWKAAKLAGLDTIPAVVQRRDYSAVTRFVRQMVENIQRDDLNDVDRAAGLLRLRNLMQEELDAAKQENVATGEPWGQKITWAKVGKRLGYSRQRIDQLVKLLHLPDEIQEAVRGGNLSERQTRVYQGLRPSHQRALHAARMAGDITESEAQQIATYLRKAPERTVAHVIRLLRQPAEERSEPLFTQLLNQPSSEPTKVPLGLEDSGYEYPPDERPEIILTTDLLPRHTGPTGIARLGWIRGHLATLSADKLSPREHQEMLRLLKLIQQDVVSLIAVLESQA